MGLIDSHAHLTDDALLERVGEVLARAVEAGVERVITIAQDVSDADQAIALAREHGVVHATAGIHPHEASKVADSDWARLETQLNVPEVVACGEIGLDYHYDFSPPDVQQEVFGRQLDLAVAADLPIVVHCREAFDDTVCLLLDHGFASRPVVVHCYSGTVAQAEVMMGHGWRLSFTGTVTYKSAGEVRDVAREYPADQLMIETDCPYLAPVPIRGRFPNEPAYLTHTAEFLAKLRGEAIETFIEQTAANTRAFFRLDG